MNLLRVLDQLFFNKFASYQTYSWKQLPHSLREQLFKQNLVQADDYKNLVYFIFKVDDYQLILVDTDFNTLRFKVESAETLHQFQSMVMSLPYHFVV